MKKFNNRKKITKKKLENYNYKEVALTKMAKRQLFVTLLSIIGVTVISLGSAYAVFTSISRSAEYNVIKVGTLNIDFGADSSNTINLTGQYPMSDEEGVTLTPYTFTITNTGTLTADYEVFIQDDQDMITHDNCANNQLNKDYIRYKLDTGNPINLSSIAGSNYRIATGTLEAGGSVTYTLYVWIREGVGNDVLNKHYHGKIVVNGTNEIVTASDTLLAKANAEDLDYNSATDEQKKEMWTFSHPATEQTEALTDYRYIGADPNNYVTFNNETWRIIGVFTVDDGAGNKEQRLKLIRDESIGNYSWDNKPSGTGSSTNNNGSNDWTDARINYLLNPGHESESVGGSLYWNSGSGTCYSGSNNATVSCNFSETGLKEEARNMIGDSLWYLGGSTYSGTTVSTLYEDERGISVYSGSGRETNFVGKVGLAYPSDIGYATSGGSITNRNTCLNNTLYGWNDDCVNNNWLYRSNDYQWTISHFINESYVVLVYGSSYYKFYGILTANASKVYPTIYLKANVQIVEGDGSSSNPYILAS